MRMRAPRMRALAHFPNFDIAFWTSKYSCFWVLSVEIWSRIYLDRFSYRMRLGQNPEYRFLEIRSRVKIRNTSSMVRSLRGVPKCFVHLQVRFAWSALKTRVKAKWFQRAMSSNSWPSKYNAKAMLECPCTNIWKNPRNPWFFASKNELQETF